ncbi:glycoside hydrolase family 71 protein [Biscogniauxia mediterranea]|nr:glycoside hydrolase family 71 protein [Biscogniauxia mediterranea]
MHRPLNSSLAILLASFALLTQHLVQSKLVFAHYLVGTVDPSTDHAKQDIDQAISVGFDAFALNVGAPDADWARSTIQQLFDHARGTDFKLFLSFDFYGSGDMAAHEALYRQFQDEAAYLRYGSGSLPVVSSYSGGALGADAWRGFKAANNVYLLPNAEAAADYYSRPASFFQAWGDAVDGVFSWETAWPDAGDAPANVSSARDEDVKAAADAAGKAYMMGLSSLQYKHCCGASWYRTGETNLPERMTQILSVQPEFTEVITWNDAGESHYIGPCWPEGLTEEILQYGDSAANPHAAWQPLVSSFIAAFKAGAPDAGGMVPPGGGAFAGAMWYRPVTKSCTGDVPRGSGAALDAVNYAIVLPAGGSSSDGMKVRVTSGGRVLATLPAQAGLNYGSVPGMVAGAQKVELLGPGGGGDDDDVVVVAAASSVVDVSDAPTDGFCNYNYYVVGLA